MTILSAEQYLAALHREGEVMAAAAARAGADAEIATCPGWRMRDLLLHTGGVHRWAAAHVRDRRTEEVDLADPSDIADELPDDSGLLTWFREGHAALVDTLAAADPDVACFTFLPAPTPLLFWARRQAHETTIHRVDAEQPDGAVTPVAAPVAADGIDELLRGFVAHRPYKLRTMPPHTFAVHATDTDDHWTVRTGTDPVTVTRTAADRADCTISGTAHDLYLKLWNRGPTGAIEVTGDSELLARWPDIVQVRWSGPRR